MRLATLRLNGSHMAVRVDSESAVEIPGFKDVGQLLQNSDWRAIAEAAAGEARSLEAILPEQWEAVIPAPRKIVCVGLNYTDHIAEMGHAWPEFPTLFNKYPDALIGPFDPIVLPAIAPDKVDWEAELAVVIGKRASHVSESEAPDFIAGYSIMNDVSMRDFQNRTPQWLQGKTFEKSAPFGPYLVTPDQFESGRVKTTVDGRVVQDGSTANVVFAPAALIAYITSIFPLDPGDVIITGTPGGVGHARKPAEYLRPGQELVIEIEGLGSQVNQILAASTTRS